MTVRVTSDGINGLAARLEAAGDDVVPEAKKVLGRAGFNIKKDAQAKSKGIKHAPNYPRSITYDTEWSGDSGRVEIGPDKDKQVGSGPHRTPGNLGHIFEYGTAKTPAQAHLGPALDYEGPNFERYMGELAAKLLS